MGVIHKIINLKSSTEIIHSHLIAYKIHLEPPYKYYELLA